MLIAIITMDISYTLEEYRMKGYKVNKNNSTATYEDIKVYFIEYDTQGEYKKKLRGLLLDDIHGIYDSEDITRLKSYGSKVLNQNI